MWRVILAAACAMTAPWSSQAQDGSFEQASSAFIQRYLDEWSAPAPVALAYMDQVYPGQVDFYGKPLSHEALMNVKRNFVARWPERTLNVRPASIQAVCDPDHKCKVQAIFDWHYRSTSRQAVSSGAAMLTLELQDGMAILSENGAVVPSGLRGLPVLAPVAHIPPVAPQLDIATAPVAGPSQPQEASNAMQENLDSQRKAADPQRDEIAELRNNYLAHAADKDWIATWLAQRRNFSGEAVFVGSTKEQAGPSPNDVLRTDGFASAVGTIACIDPDDAATLKIGEKVNIHGVITIFIEDVMYLGQCGFQPG